MCGRFAFDIDKPVFQRRFGVRQLEIALTPHYNVAPGMLLPTVIRQSPNSAVLMKWGLIPHWSREFKVKFSNINARAETVTTSPAYSFSFRTKRCLIPAIGFYEWARLSDGTKWPYYFTLKSRSAFAFAGIWDVWRDAEGLEFPTCAIITCPANSVVGKIHPRMPVILPEADEDTWLDSAQTPATLTSLLVPYDDSNMLGTRISTRVNSPDNDDKNITEPE